MKHILSKCLLMALVIILGAGCATMQSRWKDTLSKNTVVAYEEFLRKYPEGEFTEQANIRIEALYYTKAKDKNTISAYEGFLGQYPQADEFTIEASQKLEALYFDKAKDTGTIAAYEDFLRSYPEGKLAGEASLRLEMLYLQKAKDTNTITAYEEFLGRYPQSKFKDEVHLCLDALHLYEESRQFLKLAQEAEMTNYSLALKYYKDTLEKLEKIEAEYPSSQLAKDLIQGKAIIDSYTIHELKEKVIPLANIKAAAEGNPLFCAFLIAHKISPSLKVSKPIILAEIAGILAEIAGVYAETGKKDKSSEILLKALQLATTIESSSEKFDILPKKVDILTLIASTYGKADKKEIASEILSRALEAASRETDFLNIAKAYIEIGQYNQSLQVIKKITILYYLRDLAGKFAEAGQYNHALSITKKIESPSGRVDALSKIAAAYGDAGQKDKVSEILSHALSITKKIESPSDKVDALSKIAAAYGDAGQKDKVSEILSHALSITKKIESPSDKVDAYAMIAGKYAKVDQEVESSKILSNALEVAKQIKSSLYSARALCMIAGRYIIAEQYDQAFQVVKRNSGYEDLLLLLPVIAGGYIKTGQKDKALEVLNYAHELALIFSPPAQQFALKEIAIKYGELGQVNKAIEIAKTVDHISWLLWPTKYEETPSGLGVGSLEILHAIGINYAEIGQYNRALEIAKTIDYLPIQVEVLIKTAYQYLKKKQIIDDKARTLLHEIIANNIYFQDLENDYIIELNQFLK